LCADLSKLWISLLFHLPELGAAGLVLKLIKNFDIETAEVVVHIFIKIYQINNFVQINYIQNNSRDLNIILC
jgi:hypothetical protein